MPEQPVRLYPGDKMLATLVEHKVPHLDDDWFRFYGTEPGTLVGTVYFEVHEMCGRSCQYRGELCPWHPPSCTCSDGWCQRT